MFGRSHVPPPSALVRCPRSVYVVDDVVGAIAQTASVVDVDQTIITFTMPPSQGRKRIYVQVDGQVGGIVLNSE